MTEALMLMLACLSGIAIGMLFFIGLWWTLRKGLRSRVPALWFVGSLMARMTGAMAGFYLVSGHHWGRLLACLVGFVLARLVVTRFTRAASKPICLEQESSHAPYTG